eukprot:sb/3470779/
MRGESTDDIPVEIESNCQKISTNLHKQVVTNETKMALINLYKSLQTMPDSKDKKDRLKKFEKQYPHYIMELNNLSHSPIIRTKSTRKPFGSSLSRLISGSKCGSMGSLTHLQQSTPCKEADTPSGTKRKALEMLQMSPTPQPSASTVNLQTPQQQQDDDDEPSMRSVRRKLDENMEDGEDEMMEYRDLGESYREYFI